jgi:hypothetical protein
MMYSPDLMNDETLTLTRVAIDPKHVSRDAFRRADFRAYLVDLMSAFREPLPRATESIPPELLPAHVFQLLSSTEYCYLSGERVAPYRIGIHEWVARAVAAGEPIRFFYDLGGGYHASHEPGGTRSFEIGLGELMVLRQIRSLVARIAKVYEAGATFTLIVDNVSASLIDGVAIDDTVAWCDRLRGLIHETQMSGIVDLLVESEHFTYADFARLDAQIGSTDRARLYDAVTDASARLMSSLIDGVHLAQRASPAKLCFRPFPGGDSRIQAGQVALLADVQNKVRPVLLTSRNAGDYSWLRDTTPDYLPPSIPGVIYARPFTG